MDLLVKQVQDVKCAAARLAGTRSLNRRASAANAGSRAGAEASRLNGPPRQTGSGRQARCGSISRGTTDEPPDCSGHHGFPRRSENFAVQRTSSSNRFRTSGALRLDQPGHDRRTAGLQRPPRVPAPGRRLRGSTDLLVKQIQAPDARQPSQPRHDRRTAGLQRPPRVPAPGRRLRGSTDLLVKQIQAPDARQPSQPRHDRRTAGLQRPPRVPAPERKLCGSTDLLVKQVQDGGAVHHSARSAAALSANRRAAAAANSRSRSGAEASRLNASPHQTNRQDTECAAPVAACRSGHRAGPARPKWYRCNSAAPALANSPTYAAMSGTALAATAVM